MSKESAPTDLFLIYVDRLKEGTAEELIFSADSSFLEVEEADLSYEGEVTVKGQAYLAGNELVVSLRLVATALIPCAICNERVKTPVIVESFYHVVPPKEFASGIYSFKEAVRTAIILDSPRYVECGGNCPERASLAHYIKQKKEGAAKDDDDTYHPFAGLNL